MHDPLMPEYMVKEMLRRRRQAEAELKEEERWRRGRNGCLNQLVCLAVLAGLAFGLWTLADPARKEWWDTKAVPVINSHKPLVGPKLPR